MLPVLIGIALMNWNWLVRVIAMSAHKISFCGEIKKSISVVWLKKKLCVFKNTEGFQS